MLNILFKANQKQYVHLFFITVVGLLVYANTFDVTFLFDDIPNIAENYRLRELSSFWPPEGSRWFGMFTLLISILLTVSVPPPQYRFRVRGLPGFRIGHPHGRGGRFPILSGVSTDGRDLFMPVCLSTRLDKTRVFPRTRC